MGEGPRGRRPHPPPRDRGGEADSHRIRSSRAGRGASHVRLARSRIAASRPSSPRRSVFSEPPRTRAGTGTRRTSTASSRSPRRCPSRSARRSSPPPTATRRARTARSTTPARSSARPARSPTRSPTTCRCRSSPRASRDADAAKRKGGAGAAPHRTGSVKSETASEVVPLAPVEPQVEESSEDAA